MNTGMRLELFDTIEGELDKEGYAFRTHDELDEATYHARPEWSVSQFKLLPHEPELFWGRHIARLPDYQVEETPAMRLGSAVHQAVLEGREVRVIPAEALSKSGSRAGAAWKQFEAEHAGETWLRDSEAEPAKRAVDAVMRRSRVRKLLESDGEPELSIFWRCEFTGLCLRGRLDRYCRIGNGIILDLKTANDPTAEGFPWKCLDLGYDVQAAAYITGAAAVFAAVPDAFIFVAVEVQPPYRCRIFESDRTDFLNEGFCKMQEALFDLKSRLETDSWEAVDADAVHTLRLPKRKLG